MPNKQLLSDSQKLRLRLHFCQPQSWALMIMKLTKKEVAKIQLEKAVDCFVHERDMVSSITLAGASEELLGNIIRENDGKHALEIVFDSSEMNYEKYQEFRDAANNIRNELKHSRDNPNLDGIVEVYIDDCAQILFRALYQYPLATGETTEKMQEGWYFILNNYSRIFE